MKRSAGILVYKNENNKIHLLLCHPGGPYKKNLDAGVWSIPKGEKNKKEKIINTAIREFNEETNLKINSKLEFLASKKIRRNKLAIIFYTNENLDISNCKSNTFKLEFPRKSGIINTYPEMDKYKWMDIEEARRMISKNQIYFIDKLEEKLKR